MIMVRIPLMRRRRKAGEGEWPATVADEVDWYILECEHQEVATQSPATEGASMSQGAPALSPHRVKEGNS